MSLSNEDIERGLSEGLFDQCDVIGTEIVAHDPTAVRCSKQAGHEGEHSWEDHGGVAPELDEAGDMSTSDGLGGEEEAPGEKLYGRYEYCCARRGMRVPLWTRLGSDGKLIWEDLAASLEVD
jgi:hypothetical protein